MAGFVLVVLTLLALSSSPATGQTAPPAPRDSGPAVVQGKPSQSALIDINRASEKELTGLPGIGRARAEAIMKGRPYKSKDELVRRKIIPENVYKEIRDRIVAHQR